MSEKRLFAAVNLPLELKREIYSKYSRVLDSRLFKIVDMQNLHFTTCFLGETPTERIPGIESSLDSLKAFKSFEAKLEGFGSFGDKVLWIGLSEGKKQFEELALGVCEALGVSGKKVSAHLTIARNRKASKQEFEQALKELKALSLGEKFLVTEFCLFESKLSSKGPEYSIISSFRLS